MPKQTADQFRSHHLSFLVRMWETTDVNGATVWRASLQRPHENTRQGFGNLEALFAFLANECEHAAPDIPTDTPNEP